MKTPLTMPEEQQPKNIKRADVLMKHNRTLVELPTGKATIPIEE